MVGESIALCYFGLRLLLTSDSTSYRLERFHKPMEGEDGYEGPETDKALSSLAQIVRPATALPPSPSLSPLSLKLSSSCFLSSTDPPSSLPCLRRLPQHAIARATPLDPPLPIRARLSLSVPPPAIPAPPNPPSPRRAVHRQLVPRPVEVPPQGPRRLARGRSRRA